MSVAAALSTSASEKDVAADKLSAELNADILLVDDTPENLRILSAILSKRGYKVRKAINGENAIKAVQTKLPDLILMDIMMPGMDGYETTKILKNVVQTQDIPIIFVSAIDSASDKVLAFDIGAADYISKPFHVHEVLARVKNQLTIQALNRDLRQSSDRLRELNTKLEQMVRKRTEQLNRSIFYDPSTQLPNQVGLEQAMSKVISPGQVDDDRRTDKQYSLISLKFPQIFNLSTSLGEEFSRKLFANAIGRIRQSLQSGDVLAKTCDDTFSILMSQTEDRLSSSVTQAILNDFKSVLKFDKNQVLLTPSAGIVEDISGYSETSHIIRDSNIAAQYALNTEASSFHIFTYSSYSYVMEQIELETSLCAALENDELFNHYQPLYNLASRKLVSFEALVRWQHPEKGLVYPSLFIPHVEATGSIVPLGMAVIARTCGQIQQWNQSGYEDVSVAVNLSARQLAHPSLVDDIQALIKAHNIAPQQLKFEVTESALLEHISIAADAIDRLHNLGMTVSIDDFGTGYSSLSYLQQLPFDGLKIDRSFIQGIGLDGENTEILEAIIGLAHSLNMTVTAEGIETLEQLEVLRELGCDYGQGYLLGMPSPADECSLSNDWES